MNAKEYNQKQPMLFPPHIRQLLADDHPAVIINDIIDNMDLNILYKKLSSEGNPPYHPAMMMKVLIYAYTNRIFGSRKIQRALWESVAFMFLAAWQKPDFRTISDFRKNNLCEFKTLFALVLEYCKRMKMTTLGHIAIDGSKFKANAADRNTWSKKRIDRKIKKLLDMANQVDSEEDSILGADKSGDEIPPHIQKQADRVKELQKIRKQLEESEKSNLNTTDPDASFMKSPHGITTSYNGQIAVEEKSKLILAADVTTDAADVDQLLPMLDQVESNIGRPDEVSADSGYSSGKNLRALDTREIEGYIPDPEFQGNQRKPIEEIYFHRSKFILDEAEDCFICPAGQKLFFSRLQKNSRIYQCSGSADCPMRAQCTKNPSGRTICLSPYAKELNAMRQRLESEAGRRIYKKRQVIVEPVFATLKRAMGFDRFLLRGLQKVRGEFTLLCMAHNVRKLTNYLIKHGINPQTA